VSDHAPPPDQSHPAPLPDTVPTADLHAAFEALLPRLHAAAFRLGGLHGFSGMYRLVEVDDVEDAVIIAREGNGQRLGLSILDFVNAYRQGYNGEGREQDRSQR
jgi:hypothetical protein